MAEQSNSKPLETRVIAERVLEGEETSELVSRLEAESEEEVASSVTLRWGKGQVAIAKRAAAILGVPYQTYLKQVVVRQAIADIEQAQAVLDAEPKRRASSSSRSH
jgi:predicted DNA binding CopG/RHH family protein